MTSRKFLMALVTWAAAFVLYVRGEISGEVFLGATSALVAAYNVGEGLADGRAKG